MSSHVFIIAAKLLICPTSPTNLLTNGLVSTALIHLLWKYIAILKQRKNRFRPQWRRNFQTTNSTLSQGNKTYVFQICHIEAAVSCVSWLPSNPFVCVLGTAEGATVLYNASTGRRVPVVGLDTHAVTAAEVHQIGYVYNPHQKYAIVCR